jgi:hypothetical protein
MTPRRCPACGLVAFATDTTCRRCRSDLRPGSIARNRSAIAGQGPTEMPTRSSGFDAGAPAGGAWRDGRMMILHRQASVPDFCVKCGAPARGLHISRRWSANSRRLPIYGVLGGIVGALLAEAVNSAAEARDPNLVSIKLGLCQAHIDRKRLVPWILGPLLVLAVLQILMAQAGQNGDLLNLSGIVCIMLGCALGFILDVRAAILRCDDSHIWVKGVSPLLLSRLPSLPR